MQAAFLLKLAEQEEQIQQLEDKQKLLVAEKERSHLVVARLKE